MAPLPSDSSKTSAPVSSRLVLNIREASL